MDHRLKTVALRAQHGVGVRTRGFARVARNVLLRPVLAANHKPDALLRRGAGCVLLRRLGDVTIDRQRWIGLHDRTRPTPGNAPKGSAWPGTGAGSR